MTAKTIIIGFANLIMELRRCVKVEVAVLRYPSLRSLMVSVAETLNSNLVMPRHCSVFRLSQKKKEKSKIKAVISK